MPQILSIKSKQVCFLVISLILFSVTRSQAQFVWANDVNITGDNAGKGMVVDGQGNVYNTGNFTGTFDADPGPGISNLTSHGSYDVYIIKYDNNGNFIWAKSFGGSGQDDGISITTDASGNVYVAGDYRGSVDFDPGPGDATHVSDGGSPDTNLKDAFIVKFSAAGDFIWVKVFDNISNNYGQEYISYIATDNAGNVYATGDFLKPLDIDPGPGIVSISGIGSNYNTFLVKLDQSGNFVNGFALVPSGLSGSAASLVVKNSNVYATVFTNVGFGSIVVTKFDLDLTQAWQVTENFTTVMMTDVDAAGNIILVGGFTGTVDFDPGPAVYNLSIPGGGIFQQMFVTKLNNNGQFQWAKVMGTSSDGIVNAVGLDPQNGDVYLGGRIDAPTFFDGTNPNSYLVPLGPDGFIEKLDMAGNFGWVLPISGSGNCRIANIDIDQSANIIFHGAIMGDNDFNPSPQQSNVLTGGASSLTGNFNCKWGPYAIARQFYNTKANLGLQNTGTWSDTPVGTGASPQNFTDPGQTFMVINQANANLSGQLSISGLNSALVIGDGTAMINLIVPAGNTFIDRGTIVDVLNNATLTIQNNIIPTLKNLSNGSTVDFAQQGTGNSDTISIPLQNYYDIRLTNGLKYFSKDTLNVSSNTYQHTIVRNNLVADGVVSMNGTYLGGNNSSQVECLGDVSFLNGTAFEPDLTGMPGRFELLLTGSQQQHVNANGTELFFSNLYITAPAVTMSANANINIGSSLYTQFYLKAGSIFYTTAGSLSFIHGGMPDIEGAIASDHTSINMLRDDFAGASPNVLRFTTSSTIKDFLINIDDLIPWFYVGSNINISGTLTLTKGKMWMSNGDTLELNAGSTVLGGSAMSFVKGAFKRTGSFPFTFHVGEIGKYAPVEFLSSTGNNSYVVNYSGQTYPVHTIDPATLALYPNYGISGVEYWNITPGSTGGSADLVFHYNNGSYVYTPTELRIAHFDGTDWNDLGGTADALNTTTSGKVTVTGVSTFSPFTFAGTVAGVVPVKLTSFSVRKQNTSVQLYWTTEQEINSKSFVIERSSDGIKWNEITRLNAAGNSSVKINYNTTDYDPAKGINYYRLKQVDVDGRFNYSEIRSVYFGNDVNVIVAPNPAKDKVTVYLPGNSSMISIKIFNENGQLVKEVLSIEESVQVNLSSFAKGIYTLKLNGKNINEARKLIVD